VRKTRVTEEGLLIPKSLLEGIDRVEIRKERNIIVVVPLPRPTQDPVLELGRHPVQADVDDASVRHDHYLGGQ
jgi:virulence-associated protein VagC